MPAIMGLCMLVVMTFTKPLYFGAAQLLKEREAELKGTVRLIFQPAEENFQGAYQVIEAGGIEGVSAIIGYHNNPHLKPGQIGLRSGAIMAGVEQFRVDVKGVSSHAARPDLGVDTVLVTYDYHQQFTADCGSDGIAL